MGAHFARQYSAYVATSQKQPYVSMWEEENRNLRQYGNCQNYLGYTVNRVVRLFVHFYRGSVRRWKIKITVNIQYLRGTTFSLRQDILGVDQGPRAMTSPYFLSSPPPFSPPRLTPPTTTFDVNVEELDIGQEAGWTRGNLT